MPAKKKSKSSKAGKTAKKATVKPAKTKKPIGRVEHFFDKIQVAVVKVNAPIKLGDKICIEGHGKRFEQKVISMQIEHEPIKTAKKGQSIGMKVNEPVKEGDLVYKA